MSTFSSPVFLGLVVVGFAVLSGAVPLFLRRKSGPRPTFKVEYVAKAPLTPTEAKIMRLLTQAVPDAVISPQMAMAALMDVADHQKQRNNSKYNNVNRAAFAQKRLDLVLLDPQDLTVVCVLELDDKTHDAPSRKKADQERDALLESLGYPVLRLDARRMPSVTQLREHFSPA